MESKDKREKVVGFSVLAILVLLVALFIKPISLYLGALFLWIYLRLSM